MLKLICFLTMLIILFTSSHASENQSSKNLPKDSTSVMKVENQNKDKQIVFVTVEDVLIYGALEKKNFKTNDKIKLKISIQNKSSSIVKVWNTNSMKDISWVIKTKDKNEEIEWKEPALRAKNSPFYRRFIQAIAPGERYEYYTVELDENFIFKENTSYSISFGGRFTKDEKTFRYEVLGLEVNIN